MKFLSLLFLVFFLTGAESMGQLTISALNEARRGEVAEFRIDGVPVAANRFDPAQGHVTARVIRPSGKEMMVRAYWHQEYRRALSGGREVLTATGTPHWRLRVNPDEGGEHRMVVTAIQADQTAVMGEAMFSVVANSPAFEVAKVSFNRRFLETNGVPLRLVGANVCWPGNRGTFDYTDWFAGMKRGGENFARLWMSPWAFGIEAEANTLTKYRLDRAWQLDEVFRIAQTNGIYLMLCLDYHGMFSTTPDFWGGNDNWKINPYNQANGGPSAQPNDFFTGEIARQVYQKRLEYLVARYGAYRNLLAWQFYNEIDNVYNVLNGSSVAAWHTAMARYLRSADPYGHLITTSLTSMSDRPEIWNIAELDFSMFHSYGLAQPASKLPGIIQGMHTKYNKPVMVGEYGIDFRGWMRENDPHLRGLRQGLWAGLLGGSVGTSMSWWWENLHAENVYPQYMAMQNFASKTGLGQGEWKPIEFVTSGNPPSTVGEAVPGGAPFAATLNLNAQWGMRSAGQLALVNEGAAQSAPASLNSFFHGSAHADLRNPFVISAWFGDAARMVMHLNSVSSGAIIEVRVDGVQKLRQSVPNRDGGWEVNNEYNEELPLIIAPGKHRIEIRNAGSDWFYLDWVRFENVLPSDYANGWKPSPVAVGMKHAAEGLVYVVNPAVNFPAGATNPAPALLTNETIHLTNWVAGKYEALWYDAKTGAYVGRTQAESGTNHVKLPLPDFREDISGRIIPEQRIDARAEVAGLKVLTMRPVAGSTVIESSTDLRAWHREKPLEFGSTGIETPIGPEPFKVFRVATEW